MPKFPKLIHVLFAIVITAGSVLAQNNTNSPKPLVTVVEATMKSVSDSGSFSGRIAAKNSVDIIARVAGFVESITFDDGSTVNQGDALIGIEPDAYEAAITQIQGQIKAAEAEKTLADIDLDRQQKLLAKGDVAENVVQRAQAQQGKVAGQLEQLKGSLQLAQLDLSYTKITAPFDGRIGLTDLAVGAFVNPSNGALLTLSSIDPINVVFPVTEAELIEFRDHKSAETGNGPLKLNLTLANGDTYAEDGSVDVVDTTVQEGTDSVLIRGTFPNPKGKLIDGQLVQVTITAQTDDKRLVVPSLALQKDQAGYFVLTVDQDGVVAKTVISLYRVAGADAVISSGLSEGDKVITEGVQKVRVGMTVQTQEPQSSDPSTPASD